MRTRIRLVTCCICFVACSAPSGSESRGEARATEAAAGTTAPNVPSVANRMPDVVAILPAAPTSAAPSLPGASSASPNTPVMPGEACAGVDEMAETDAPPVDIIIAVDSSSSMTAETMFVQMQLNQFAQQIVSSMIDARLILICEKLRPQRGLNPICIPPPLAAANCGDNEPRFNHIDQFVSNHDAWDHIIAKYPEYKHLLRPGAQKHIVVITDDSPGLPRMSFDQMLKATDPQFSGYKHHAIYASMEFGDGPFCGEGEGSDYGRLSDETHGVKGNLCLQDFEKVWAELAVNVKKSATLACDWQIPPPPAGQTFDPQRVNVHYSGMGVAPQLIGWVPSANDCGAAMNGWYYDNIQSPTRVITCPQTCDAIRKLDKARIDIKFGCNRCSGLDANCGGEPPPKPPELL